MTEQEKKSKEEEFKKIQLQLREKISRENIFKKENIKTIAGVDIAYWKDEDKERAVCCIIIIDCESKKVLEKKQCYGIIDVPYMPGYLAFRELPLILETVKKLKIEPDLFMFDGNGYLHARNMGIATHASFYLNKPIIGVAKSYYKINDVDFIEPDNENGAYTDIVIDDDVYGRVYRSHKDVKPIFISIGNFIDLETATELVESMITKESRIPIPTRLADIDTHEYRKKAKEIMI